MNAKSLVRALTVGIAAGAIIAGLTLMTFAFRARRGEVDCTGLSGAECDLKVQIAVEFSSTQLGLGVGLTLLGLGGLIWQSVEDRRSRRAAQDAAP